MEQCNKKRQRKTPCLFCHYNKYIIAVLPQVTPLSTVITRQVRGIATHWFVADIGTTLLGRCSSHYYFCLKQNSKC